MTMAFGAVLLVFDLDAATRTWDGGGGDPNWSTAANWDGDAAAPAAGDALVFGGSARLSNNNDLGANASFSCIAFNNDAGAFVLGGNAITLDGNVSNFSASAKTLALPMALSGFRTVFGSNAAFAVSGVLSGPGGLEAAVTNTLTLSGNNTYVGLTTVTNGCTLSITHANALGSADQGTRIFGRTGAALKLSGGITVAEPLTMTGQIPPWLPNLIGGTGSNVLTGPVYKELDARIRVEDYNKLVFVGGIIHVSGGQMALNPRTGAYLIIKDKPINFGSSANVLTEEGGTVVLAVSGNSYSQLQIGNQSKVRTDVDGALSAGANVVIGASWAPNALLNLNGCNQSIGTLSTSHYPANPGYLAITSAVPATLTVNQTWNTIYMGDIAGAVNLVKTGGATLTFTNVVPLSTTGTVTVTAGTLAVGDTTGGFGATPLIRITGGTLDLRNGNALPDAAAVRVLSGSKIKIKAGVSETVGALYLDGEQQVAGTWGATGSGADHVNDAFFSDGGVLSVSTGATNAYVAAVWDGGGTDANFSTAANWEGDALPPFDGFGRAVFAAGGSTAKVDTAATFVRMTFNANGNFTLDNGAGTLALGGGGLQAGAPTATSCTYTLAEDVSFADQQFWSLTNSGAGTTTLNVTGALSDGGQGFDLTKSGNGVLILAGDNSYGGKTTVKTNGYVVIKHANALGSAAGATSIENGGYIRIDGGSGGLTIPEPITMEGDQALGYGGTLRSNTGSNIWSGKITSYGGRLRCEAGACFEITGGADGSYLVCSAYGNRWIRFTEKPINAGALTSHTGDGGVILAVAGNTFSSFNACGECVRVDVPNAWPRTCSLVQGDGGNSASRLNLNGNDQTVGRWETQSASGSLRILFSAAPATLTVDQSANTLFNGSITGAVSIVKLGTGSLTLTNKYITTSGSFTVSNGTLAVANEGTFGPNSTNIVVAGSGTLALSNSVALADSATVKMPAAEVGTAKIALAAGVEERVGWLYFGTKMQRVGTYGATGSGANHIDDAHFAGAGVLRVLHDNAGTFFSLL